MNLTPNFDKQRELLLTGDYYSLFNTLKLNLPQRFFEYANQKAAEDKFHAIFNELDALKKHIGKNSAWCFDDVMRIIEPIHVKDNLINNISFLTDKCKVPETHIKIKKCVTNETFLPIDQIFLSSYALILLCNHLLKGNDSFKNDISEPLFVKTRKKTYPEFNSEMRLVFAGYFFAFDGSDEEEITKALWNWVRGTRLKTSYHETMRELSFLLHDTMGEKFNYHEFEEFKQTYILNVLFACNFMNKYENFLKSAGYEIQSDKKDNIKWRKGKDTAPKYPGAFFAPHVEFLLSWSVQAFCKFAREELPKHTEKNRTKTLEKLAQKFFAAVNGGYTDATNSMGIKSAPIFTEQHNSDARKITKEIKSGKGKMVTDASSGGKIKESPGALEFYKTKTLFSEDDSWCLEARKAAENRLLILHNEYKASPSPTLAKQIFKVEDDIKQENEALYGINLNTFISVPEILNQNYEFVPRHKAGNKDYIVKSEPEKPDIKASLSEQYEIDFDNPVGFEYKSILLKKAPLGEFKIMPDYEITDVKFGESITYNCYTDKDGILKKDWFLNPDGIFETVNPLVDNPTAFRTKIRDQLPKLVKENFQMRNFVIESDVMSIENQKILARKLIALGIANRVMESGNKSVHINISVKDVPNTPDEYAWLFFHICMKLGLVSREWNKEKLKFEYRGAIDLSFASNNSNTRKPNATRELEYKDANGNITKKYKIQTLLHKTNTVYDIDWRNAYKVENDWIKKQKLVVPQKNYDSFQAGNAYEFIQKYAIKNHLPLDFPQGSGHNIGCVIIGAAKSCGFNSTEIKKALSDLGCGGRYKELVGGWNGLLR